MLAFDEKVILVTGASGGIGAAIAEGFGRFGAQVVVHYGRNKTGAEAVAEHVIAAGGSAALYTADVASPPAAAGLVEDVTARFGRLDILVNNAGDLLGRYLISEMSNEHFSQVMNLNMVSVFATCRAVIPHMREAGEGAIINVTSIAARTGGADGAVAYATAKGALSTFTRGLAKEVARDGIRVNAISPGVIGTPFHERNTSSDQMASMVGAIPMGRAGTPEDCVGSVLYLASPAMSGYVTGQVIEINGGQYSA